MLIKTSGFVLQWTLLLCCLQPRKVEHMIIQEVEILLGMPQKGLNFNKMLIFSNDQCSSSLPRSKNSLSDKRLLAKLDKADRALCFTSGMAALAAITRLVATVTSCGIWLFYPFQTSCLLVVFSNYDFIAQSNIKDSFYHTTILFC